MSSDTFSAFSVNKKACGSCETRQSLLRQTPILSRISPLLSSSFRLPPDPIARRIYGNERDQSDQVLALLEALERGPAASHWDDGRYAHLQCFLHRLNGQMPNALAQLHVRPTKLAAVQGSLTFIPPVLSFASRISSPKAQRAKPPIRTAV
jgi:hypothetical protein